MCSTFKKLHTKWHFGDLRINSLELKFSYNEWPRLEVGEKVFQELNKRRSGFWRSANYALEELIPFIGPSPKSPPPASLLWMPLFCLLLAVIPMFFVYKSFFRDLTLNLDGLLKKESVSTNVSLFGKVVSGLIFQGAIILTIGLLILHWYSLDIFVTASTLLTYLFPLLLFSAWQHFHYLSEDRCAAIRDARLTHLD